mmetsp:Transcript_4927/g.19735  ORF Transcript_4927/g.19735 Transcript_4927/m.19735 type:complete len:491 (-) Transcript_4927:404-1876(-)
MFRALTTLRITFPLALIKPAGGPAGSIPSAALTPAPYLPSRAAAMRRATLLESPRSADPKPFTELMEGLFTTRGVGSVALATSSICPLKCGVWPMSLSRSSTYSLKFSTRNAMPVRSTSFNVGLRAYFSLNALDHSSRSARKRLYLASSAVNLATVTELGAPVAPMSSARRLVNLASCSFMRRFVARSSSSSSSSTLASKDWYTEPRLPGGAELFKPGPSALPPEDERHATPDAASSPSPRFVSEKRRSVPLAFPGAASPPPPFVSPRASERSAANAAARSAASVATAFDSEHEPFSSPSPRETSVNRRAPPAFAASASQGDEGLAADRPSPTDGRTPSRAAASAAAAPPSSAAFFAAAMASVRFCARACATSAVRFAVASARAAAQRSRCRAAIFFRVLFSRATPALRDARLRRSSSETLLLTLDVALSDVPLRAPPSVGFASDDASVNADDPASSSSSSSSLTRWASAVASSEEDARVLGSGTTASSP